MVGKVGVSIDWLAPWQGSAGDSATLRAALLRELPAGHVLAGEAFEVIGRRQDQDDLLVLIADGRVAWVHLTYEKSADTHWPFTRIYDSAQQWVAEFMVPNNEEWRRWSAE
jgi:hypothetical protein